MRYRVLHPFHDKYHPEDIYYPDEIVVIEDKERLNDLMELELLIPSKDNISPAKTLKEKVTKTKKKSE